MKYLNFFKALSDETRVRLLNLCLGYELNVNELVRILGMGQSRISRHLKILTESGLLNSRRDGMWVFYSAAEEGPGADFIQSIRHLFHSSASLDDDRRRAEECIQERSRTTTRFFNSVAVKWETLKKEIIGEVDLNRRILDALPPGGTVVDLGCGTGDLLPFLKEKADYVIGVERSPRMLKEARKHFHRDKDRIDIRIGELEHLPLSDEEADAAVTNMVLHHLSEPKKAFQEAHRILKPGGCFILLDLESHADERMRSRYGDVWLGFSLDALYKWLSESGFSLHTTEQIGLKKGLTGYLLVSTKHI